MRLTRSTTIWLLLGLVAAAIVAKVLVPQPVEVPVVTVTRSLLRVTIDEPGITRVPRHAEISAPTSGRVAESSVEVGDSVSRGTVVARLSPTPLDPRAAAEAEAAARSARAVREEAAALARRATIALDEAKRAHARLEQVGATGGVAVSEVEASADAVAMRAQELAAALARERAARHEQVRALAVVRAGGSRPAAQDVLLIRAPFAGRVLRSFEQHERVVAAGTPLLEIGDAARIEVVMEVLSRDASSVVVGQVVLFELASGESAHGRVIRVEPAAFTRTSALGIDEQRVRVVSQPLAPMPGVGDAFELPSAIVVWEGEDVLSVPPSALVPMGEGWAVFVVRDGRARQQSIDVGHRGTQLLEVSMGLEVGDVVILQPDPRLRDGARVRPRS